MVSVGVYYGVPFSQEEEEEQQQQEKQEEDEPTPNFYQRELPKMSDIWWVSYCCLKNVWKVSWGFLGGGQGKKNLVSVVSRILDNLPSVRQMKWDKTQSNVYLLQTTRQSLTKATAINQYYLIIQ